LVTRPFLCNGTPFFAHSFWWGAVARHNCSAIQRINIAAAVRDANARAEEGSACGQNALATLYFGGSGVAPSGKEMVSLHSKAAQPATSLHWEHVTKTG
jgi:hypothetical protein